MFIFVPSAGVEELPEGIPSPRGSEFGDQVLGTPNVNKDLYTLLVHINFHMPSAGVEPAILWFEAKYVIHYTTRAKANCLAFAGDLAERPRQALKITQGTTS